MKLKWTRTSTEHKQIHEWAEDTLIMSTRWNYFLSNLLLFFALNAVFLFHLLARSLARSQLWSKCTRVIWLSSCWDTRMVQTRCGNNGRHFVKAYFLSLASFCFVLFYFVFTFFLLIIICVISQWRRGSCNRRCYQISVKQNNLIENFLNDEGKWSTIRVKLILMILENATNDLNQRSAIRFSASSSFPLQHRIPFTHLITHIAEAVCIRWKCWASLFT